MPAVFELSDLPPWAFDKEDSGDDTAFYADARLITHIDDAAITALTEFYRGVLPAGGVVLDLMSSCVSHLPPEIAYAEVIGHGMNGEELAANARLDRWFLHDLNRDPGLPLADASLDAATICVGVQYLQQPIPVLRDVRRTLKPGAPLVVSFSNRCFSTKAIAAWLQLDDRGHTTLVQRYLDAARFSEVEAHLLVDGRQSDPLIAVVGRA